MLLLLLTLPDIPDEDRLMVQARRGNTRAIEKIYEYYFDPVYRFIQWRVNDPGLAEDLTSDVFFKFLNALQNKKAPDQSLRGWLFRVARNVLYDHYRQPELPAELDESLPAQDDTEAEFIRRLDSTHIQTALRALVADQQEVLILRFGEMLSLEDTAQRMGRSISAIKSLQFRAINALRRALSQPEMETKRGTAG